MAFKKTYSTQKREIWTLILKKKLERNFRLAEKTCLGKHVFRAYNHSDKVCDDSISKYRN